MITWVRLARPDVETRSSPGVFLVRLEHVVGLEGGPDEKLTVVLLSSGLVRLVDGNLDSVQAQLDAADRRSGAGA